VRGLSRGCNLCFLDMCSDNRIVLSSCALGCVNVSPSAKIATWRYWFRLSRDVYGCNRSFDSYTKTKTVESAVLLYDVY
jgi:hypothetical protein